MDQKLKVAIGGHQTALWGFGHVFLPIKKYFYFLPIFLKAISPLCPINHYAVVYSYKPKAFQRKSSTRNSWYQ